MDGGRRHRAAGVEPARQRDLTRRPDRQGERRGLSQTEVDGDFLREDELSPIPAPPHLAARQYSARRDRHERTSDPTHEGQATVTQRLHVAEFHTVRTLHDDRFRNLARRGGGAPHAPLGGALVGAVRGRIREQRYPTPRVKQQASRFQMTHYRWLTPWTPCPSPGQDSRRP